MKAPTCPYCDRPAELVSGDKLYPARADLHRRRFYACFPCNAWVGTHEATGEPLGTLANAALRAARGRAHAAFDPLWRRSDDAAAVFSSRSEAYAWLSSSLGIPKNLCHIAMMDAEQCGRVVDLCGTAA